MSLGPKCTSQIWKSAVIGLCFFPLKSADVSGAWTRDEPLRTSEWEAKNYPSKNFAGSNWTYQMSVSIQEMSLKRTCKWLVTCISVYKKWIWQTELKPIEKVFPLSPTLCKVSYYGLSVTVSFAPWKRIREVLACGIQDLGHFCCGIWNPVGFEFRNTAFQ